MAVTAFLMAQMLKNLPVLRKTWVRSLGWEDPLEKGMATQVFLPGEFHGEKSLVGYSPWGWEEYDTPEQTNNQNSDFEYHGTFYRSKLKQVSGVH